jgi:hypothetical protein
LERFLLSIPPYIDTSGANPAPAITYVQKSTSSLIQDLTFTYPHFSLSKCAHIRINATMQTLLQHGQVTRLPKREKHWISARMIGHLVASMYLTATQNGTLSWDITLSKIMSILFLGAFVCRSGDIARSHFYTNEEFLQWNSLCVKYKRDSQSFALEDLIVVVTLRHTKGKK